VQLRKWFDPECVERVERETAMRMAFALGLDYAEEEADIFLKRLWVDGFYMRNAKDIVYRFGLENGWDYGRIVSVAHKFADLNQSNPAPKGNSKDTRTITSDYASIKDEEGLDAYIHENKESFGVYRRKAYERFMEIYKEVYETSADIYKKETEKTAGNDSVQAFRRKQLDSSDSSDSISLSKMCDVILCEIPQLRNKTAHKTVWRHIFNNLPNRTKLGQIVNQHVFRGEVVQVDRKLLILAWLSTKNGGNRRKFEDGQQEKAFNSHMKDLNKQLVYCGMPTLDPRHPFDWLIMNTFSYVYSSSDFPDDPNADIEDFKTRISELIEGMQKEDE